MKNCLRLNFASPSLCLRSAISSICLVAIVIPLSACQKSDLGPTTAERLKSAQQRQQTVPDFYVPRKTVDYMSDLKAIKETTPASEPPKKDVPAKDLPSKEAALALALTSKTFADAKGEAGKAAAAAAAAATTATPMLAPSGALGGAAVAAAPTATPSARAAEPVAAPAPVVVASAAPTSRPTPSQDVSPVISVVAREQPEFPRDAARQGVESGAVRARLTINASGDVTNVAIVPVQMVELTRPKYRSHANKHGLRNKKWHQVVPFFIQARKQ